MADFQLKEGDTSPAITATLTDENGDPVTLTGSVARFHMATTPGETPKVNADATVSDGAAGQVRYEWTATDTDERGLYYAEFQITHGDGSVETFPNDDYITVYIAPQIA